MTAGYGPFERENEARAAAIALAGPPDPGWSILSEAQRGRMLAQAITDAGIEAGEYDMRILAWLAGFGDATCAVIAGLILRAAGTGGQAAPGLDRNLITRARELADVTGPDALREHAGEADTGMAYAVAFGEAKELLRQLASAAERLGGTS